MSFLLRISTVLLLAAGLFASPSPALSGPLDEAKAEGLVGERVDGYVGAVPGNPPAQVRALIDEVNAKRRDKYADVAKQRGVAVEAVAQIAGEKLVERAAPGEYVAGADGRWRRK